MNTLILVEFRTAEWVGAASAIREDILGTGQDAIILDVAELAYPRQVSSSPAKSSVVEKRHAVMRKLSPSLVVPEIISSSYQSIVKGSENSALLKLVKRRLLLSANSISIRIRPWLDNVDQIFLPNGRFLAAQTALALLRPRKARMKVRFYEVGEPGHASYVVSEYPIHDRINRQNQALEWLATNDPDFEKAREWLRLRATPDSTSNVFSRGWQSGVSEALRSRNVFFTSSTDEYWALGGSWHLDSWKDQYEAFGEVLAELERIGDLSATLRIHPNLLNKSFKFVKTELKNIDALRRKFPWLKVVLPHEAVDSYELLSHADRVFVSMSTIGLEASAAGKSVWCTSPTNYDEVADVRKLWDRASIRDGLSAWEVNASQALGLIAWTIQEGRVYQYSNRLDAGPLDMLPTPISLPQKIFFQTLFKVQRAFALRASKAARMHRDGHSRVDPRRG